MGNLYENATLLYIDGKWVEPTGVDLLDVVNPATEQVVAQIALGGVADVDRAVAAASAAFPAWSTTSREERLAVLQAAADEYERRLPDLAEAVRVEMGAPQTLAIEEQAPSGLAHLRVAVDILRDYEFQGQRGDTVVLREPVGVCALIAPWNWPLNQIMCKIAPALATGNTMVLKPSQVAPLTAVLITEILDAAGVPAGVFNLVHGLGSVVGTALSAHPDVDMVSFTGSTRAGVEVSKVAADTVKRVSLELGGKSANIVLPDANLAQAAEVAVISCFGNSGQSCNAPTRLLVQQDQHDELMELLVKATERLVVGDPRDAETALGPVASQTQYDKIQELIQSGIDEGARVVVGGLGKPDGLDTGFYVRPTVLTGVSPDMRVAREEIFGPVLSVLTYTDEDDAIHIANDSDYGLSGAVQSSDPEHALAVARRMRTGRVVLNGAEQDFAASFGGYKQSGNGREWGEAGFDEFIELKAVLSPRTA
jgi:aldehyde dehydrogenase (NAD+)